MFAGQLRSAPVRRRARPRRSLTAIECRDQRSVGVAAHEPRSRQCAQDVERLDGQRPRSHIAANEDEVDVLSCKLRKHGLQRRQVAVNVRQGRDPSQRTAVGFLVLPPAATGGPATSR